MTVGLEYNADRQSDALARLSQQFKNKTGWTSFLASVMPEFQAIEDVLENLLNDLNIDDAVGDQLDTWGEILRVSRSGTTDAIFRIRLKAAIFRYVSSGKWEEILQGFTILTNPRYVQAEEVFPGAVNLTAVGADDPVAIDASETVNAMQSVKAAGVRITALIVASDPPFVFDGDPDPLGEGFGDRLDSSMGGYLADRLII